MRAAPDLRDGELRLRLLAEGDVDGIERGIRDPDVVRWFGPRGTALDVFEQKLREWREGTIVPLAVLEDGSFAGHIFLELLPEQDAALISYWLLPDARGRGLATRAVRMLTQWAFDVLGTARIELWLERGNDASRRVADRSGFTYEGTLRSAGLRDGRRFDKQVFSLLPGDPPPPR